MGQAYTINKMCVCEYMYAPYIDTTLYPTFDISKIKQSHDFTLAFIVADSSNNPSWGGYYSIGSPFYKDIINRMPIDKLVCSFGGAAGKELATTIFNVDELYTKYKSVVEEYGFKRLDFDIEGPALGDTHANRRRAEAIARLLKTYPHLQVSVTVPVSTAGLDRAALEVVAQTPCSLVNIMAMDYGYIGQGDMGKAAIDAALATRKQTGKNIGVTVMIGKNDTPNEVFTLKDARRLKAFTQKNKWIKRLSIWSLERDRGLAGELSHSSQVFQEPFEYSRIFIG